MNAKSLLIATLIAAASGAVFAGSSQSPEERRQEAQLRQPATGSRAAVLAELAQARANGSLNVHPDYGTRAVASSSRLTRAEVIAQLNEARANGTLNVHPDYGNRSFVEPANGLPRVARVAR